MFSIDRNTARAGSPLGVSRQREVLARLIEITRRYCAPARVEPNLAVCDGAGFENRLHESLVALGRAGRHAAAPALRLPGRVGERAAASARRDGEGGILAWIELAGLDAPAPAGAEPAGDAVRELLRERICACAGGEGGTLGRYGAESFAWMHPSPLPLEQAVALAEAMLESLSTPCRIAGASASLLPSVGIVYFPQDGTNAAMLLMRACAAMRRARHYRMGYAFYSPILDAAFATPLGIASRMSHNAPRRGHAVQSANA